MGRLIGRRPSPAMVVALIALFMSLGGVSYGLARNSIDTREIKNNDVRSSDIRNNGIRSRDIRTGNVGGADIRNNGVTGTDVLESSLGTVPSANSASSADVANAAFSTFRDEVFSLPAGLGPHTVLTLNVPQAGSYVIIGKLSLINDDAAEREYRCQLIAGAALDAVWAGEGANAGRDDSRPVAMTVVHRFDAPGDVTMNCNNPAGEAGDARVDDRRITAIQVRALSSVAASGP
jgi:hypothetical protein